MKTINLYTVRRLYRPPIRTKFISVFLLATCYGFLESHYQGIKKYINNDDDDDDDDDNDDNNNNNNNDPLE